MSTTTKKRIKKSGVLLVLGMHRSGTSALTGSLIKLGIKAPYLLMPASEDNPKGYWESLELMQIHDRLLESAGMDWSDTFSFPMDWFNSSSSRQFYNEIDQFLDKALQKDAILVIKDPRICRIAPLWTEILDVKNALIGSAIPFRPAIEVASSLHKRDKTPLDMGCLLWLRHMLDLEYHTRETSRSFIDYLQLLKKPKTVLSKLARDINISWPKMAWDEVNGYLEKDLRHQKNNGIEPEISGEISSLIAATESAFKKLAVNSSNINAQSELDQIKKELEQREALFLPYQRYKSRAHLEVKTQLRAFRSCDIEKKKSISELSSRKKEMETQIKNLEKGNYHLEQNKILQNQQIENLHQHAKNLEQSHQNSIQQIDNKQQQIQNLQKHEKSLERKIQELQKHRQELELKAKEEAEHSRKFKEKNIALETDAENREIRIYELHANLNNSKEKILNLEKNSEDLNYQNEKLKEGLKDLQAKHASLQENSLKTKADLKNSTTALEQATHEIDRLNQCVLMIYRHLLESKNNLKDIENSNLGKLLGVRKRASKQPSNKELEERTILIRGSGVFDSDWYLDKYPDVAESQMSPFEHFVLYGFNELREPGPDFLILNTLLENPDLITSGRHPLELRKK